MSAAEKDTWKRADALLVGDRSVGRGDFVTVRVADQLFGIPVSSVRDVMGPRHVTPIPLAPPDVAGALNLRGRIVTALDLRGRLGVPGRAPNERGMCVVVEFGSDLYGLIADSAGEVLSPPPASFERNRGTIDPHWREVSAGIYRLEGQLMIVLDIDALLRSYGQAAA